MMENDSRDTDDIQRQCQAYELLKHIWMKRVSEACFKDSSNHFLGTNSKAILVNMLSGLYTSV